MAEAITAKDIKSKIIHVEDGVREFVLHYPEGLFWIQIDEMSDYLFSLFQTFVGPFYYTKIQGVKSLLHGN